MGDELSIKGSNGPCGRWQRREGMTETRRRAFGRPARPGRGLLAATIAILWIGAISPSAWGETTRWKVGGEDGLSWSSQRLASSATDFSVPGAIQIVSFGSEENIIQQLAWVEEYPLDFVVERAQARIWDNQPLPLPNMPIVDGIDTTSTGRRFKKAGQDQSGVTFFFDLGARFPANQVVFFPRQIGEDADGFAYREDYLRSYRIQVSDGLTYDTNELPVYILLKQVQFTRESRQEIVFPLQMLRYLRLTATSPSPFEIAEFQLFGGGFAPKGSYLSQVIDLGEAANFNRIEWVTEYLGHEGDSLAVVPDADARISFQMRTGTDDTPQVHYRLVNLFTKQREEVSEDEYGKVEPSFRGPIEDDRVNWSGWSSPVEVSGQRTDAPGPHRYFQFQIAMDSGSILDGIRLTSLTAEHTIPPLAGRLAGELSLLSDPRPPDVASVPAGVLTTFAYDIRAEVESSDTGFDAIRISTPSQPTFGELLIGTPPVAAIPDSVAEESDALTLFFPSHRVKSRASGILRIIFAAQVFAQGTTFNAEVFDTQSGEPSQTVLAGDANPDVTTDALRVLVSGGANRDLLISLAPIPRIISPNGDGRNDGTAISYILSKLTRTVEVEVALFDLAGRRVRSLFSGMEGSGARFKEWDGRDDAGEVVAVGIYVVKLWARADRGTVVGSGTVAVVY